MEKLSETDTNSYLYNILKQLPDCEQPIEAVLSEEVVESLYGEGYLYYESGKYAEAEMVFRVLTSLRLKRYTFWKGLGAALQMQKKYTQAIEAYGLAALYDEKQEDPYPHFHGGECLHSIGDLERAILAMRSARVIAKKNARYVRLISQIELLHETWCNQRSIEQNK